MLEIKNISYRKGGKKLLDDISATFIPGKIYGILGPNGSGKTTFLKILAGIWRQSSGSICWNGQDIANIDRRNHSRLLSLVPQLPQIMFHYTVDEFVAMGGYPLGIKYDNALIEKALEQVDTLHLRHRSVKELSCGERQRVYIARSLITGSPILLVDEPTTSLDIRHQLEIWDLLKEIRSDNKIVLISNHDLIRSHEICDEVILLSEGKCLGKGAFDDVLQPELLSKVFGVEKVLNTSTLNYALPS